MAEWEAIFLDTPKLFEPVEVIFRGRKCRTSHISNIKRMDGTDPLQFRVQTMTGSVYVGPIGTEADLEVPTAEEETTKDTELYS